MFVLRVNLSSPPRRLNYPALRTSNPSLSLSVHGFSNRQTNWILFEVSDSQLCMSFRRPVFSLIRALLPVDWSIWLPELSQILYSAQTSSASILANLTGPELPRRVLSLLLKHNLKLRANKTTTYQVYSQCSQASVRLCLLSANSWPGNRRRSAKKGLQ